MQMKKLKCIAILVACLMFSYAFAGRLDNDALEQINNSAAFGVMGLNLDYKENDPNDPTFKSTEAGTVVGFYFNPRVSFNEKIYTDLYLDYYTGKLKYDGSEYIDVETQKKTITTSVPFTGKLQHKFFDADFKTGYIFTFTENHVFQAIPYVGAGYRYWDRFNNAPKSREKYQHYKAIVGLKLNWSLTDDFILSPYVEGGMIFNARMKKIIDGNKYKLGNKPIYTGGLELNYKIFDEFFLNSFVSYTQFKYGRSSNPNPPFEPDSKTNELKAGLGIRYSWLVN
jgi:opacity protein-like surface antigen